jgi:hypothetical protein
MEANETVSSTRRGLLLADVVELAQRTAEPAVTILLRVDQPAAAHPEAELRRRALVDRAIDVVGSWWGAEPGRRIARQLGRPELHPDLHHESAPGLAMLVTPDDGQLLRLPFAVTEQVVVDRTFATRQLLEGIALNPRYRVLVLDGHHARLYECQGPVAEEVTTDGFPIHVEPPHEQDSPHRDRPLHEEARREEHRFVYRVVDEALDAVGHRQPLPLVVAAARRELALFEEVTAHPGVLVGRLPGNFAHASPTEIVEATRPLLEAERAAKQTELVDGLREARGRDRAAFGLHEVTDAASAGRGHLLAVERGFTFPKEWVDGLAPGEGPDDQPDFDDIVDDVVETVLLAGGDVEFVDDGALSACGRIAMLLRY